MDKTILHITNVYLPFLKFGGGVTAVREIAETQSKKNNVFVICGNLSRYNSDQSGPITMEKINNVKVFRAKIYFKIGKMYFIENISNLIKDIRPNIVYVHTYFGNSWIYVFKNRNRLKYKIYFMPHGSINKNLAEAKSIKGRRKVLYRLYNKLFMKIIFNNIDLILSLSKDEKENFPNYFYRKTKLYDFKLNYDMDDLRKLKIKAFEDEKVSMIYTGRITEEKGIKLMLTFLAHFFEKVKRVGYIKLVGENLLEKNLILDYENEYFKIKLEGIKNKIELIKLYNFADIYISFSKSENFGLSPVESIICGTPIIVYKTGIFNDDKFDKLYGINYIDENVEDTLIKLISNFNRQNFKETVGYLRNMFLI